MFASTYDTCPNRVEEFTPRVQSCNNDTPRATRHPVDCAVPHHPSPVPRRHCTAVCEMMSGGYGVVEMNATGVGCGHCWTCAIWAYVRRSVQCEPQGLCVRLPAKAMSTRNNELLQLNFIVYEMRSNEAIFHLPSTDPSYKL